MDDLLEKVERAGQLNEKFTELVQITSDILRIAEDSPEGARLEAQVKKLGDKASQPAVMHPVVEAKLEEMESSLAELKKRIALTPSVTEIAQLRELVVDRYHSEPVFAFGPTYPNFACAYTSIRCKKLKVQLSDKQLTTEKPYDLKMGAHLNRLHEWESKIGSTVRDRFLVLEDNWETTGKDMDVFRKKFDDGLRRMDREMESRLGASSSQMEAHDLELRRVVSSLLDLARPNCPTSHGGEPQMCKPTRTYTHRFHNANTPVRACVLT